MHDWIPACTTMCNSHFLLMYSTRIAQSVQNCNPCLSWHPHIDPELPQRSSRPNSAACHHVNDLSAKYCKYCNKLCSPLASRQWYGIVQKVLSPSAWIPLNVNSNYLIVVMKCLQCLNSNHGLLWSNEFFLIGLILMMRMMKGAVEWWQMGSVAPRMINRSKLHN